MPLSARCLTLTLLALAAHAQAVRVLTARSGVVAVPLEEYVEWVLAGEAGGIIEPAALDAIAVAIRSYARANMGRHAAEGYDFCETTHCQDARPYSSSPRLEAAVDRTANQILWRNNRPVPGFHHRHCGGRTASPREVWSGESDGGLVSIEDAYCASAAGASWRTALNLSSRDIRIARRTPSGRVATLRDNGRLLDAEAFHLEVGRSFGWNLLRSRLYDLRREGGRLIAQGRGHGHGVGLCQSGAAARARAGHSTDAILEAYFSKPAIGITPGHRRWLHVSTARLDIRHAGSAIAVEAESALTEAERLSDLRAPRRFTVVVHPTVDLYRDLTGSPGFVAASTRGGVIRVQPAAILERAGRLRSTLRHEFLHALIGAHAKRPLPEWFSEGLALWLERPTAAPAALKPNTESALSSPVHEQALRAAYENARAAVAALVKRHGRARVLDSLRLGLPE